MKLFLRTFAVLLLVGCGNPDPAATFDEMEGSLLAASQVSFDFAVTAEGVIEGNFTGSVETSADGTLALRSTGNFIGRDLEMEMATDGDSLRMVTTEMSDALPNPPETFKAMVIGLTRMGIMHNLAALSTVSPPEHSDGGIEEWVTVGNFESGQVGEHDGVAFNIFVDGDRTSDVTLAIVDGLPVLRRQVVQFPGGEMIVTEEYSNFRVVK
ncbi:MAG: hypothetical protein HKN29_07130 [Rhodothermales bacterium]|nr:hypothetical protein [Rhodothermales bacterium]